jgi:hypothetical protein
MFGNLVTIGQQTNNRFFIEWSSSDNAANNRTTISWAAKFRFTLADAQLDNGSASLTGSSGTSVASGTRSWSNSGRVKNFESNFTTRDVLLASGSFVLNHNVNGQASLTVSGGINVGGGTTRSSGSETWALTDYDRTPTTPVISASSRAVTGSSFSVTSWSGSVNNGGPTVTWTLQRSTASNFSSNLVDVQSTTTSGTTLTSASLDPNTTYYYRIRASNSDTTNTSAHPNPKFSTTITSDGVPTPPQSLSVTPSTTDAGKINLSWSAPSNTQGSITGYSIFVNDVLADTTTSTSIANVRRNTSNNALVPNTTYTYKVAARNATNNSATTVANLASSITSGIAAKAPGPPTAPTYGSNPNPPSKTGRNVTIAIGNNADSINTNTPIINYYVQYQNSVTSDGTYSAWSTPELMSLSGDNRVFTYQLLPAALWYKFRVYAKNSIINTVNPSSGAITRSYYPDDNLSYTANFSAETVPLFVSAGGRRFRGPLEPLGSTWQPTENAKRWNGTAWIDLENAKRWDGTAWVDLS